MVRYFLEPLTFFNPYSHCRKSNKYCWSTLKISSSASFWTCVSKIAFKQIDSEIYGRFEPCFLLTTLQYSWNLNEVDFDEPPSCKNDYCKRGAT